MESEVAEVSVVKAIEELVWLHDISFMEAAVQYAEDHEMEIEVVAAHIMTNQNVTDAIRLEAEELNFIEKENRLDI